MGFLSLKWVKIIIFTLLLIPLLGFFNPLLSLIDGFIPCSLSLDNLCGIILLILEGLFLFVIYLIACLLVFIIEKIVKKEII